MTDAAEERVAPVLPLRGPERLLGTRSVSEPLDEAQRFEAFVASIRDRIEQLAKTSVSAKQLGREVLAILRQIIREHSDPTTHDDAVDTLFHRLWGEPAMQRLFVDLHNRACAVLHSPHTSVAGLEQDLVIAELEEIVSWYQIRRSNLALLGSRRTQDDALINLKVYQDASSLGAPGCEVSCGLCLIGHKSEELWLKVFVRSHGQLVSVREGWEHWVDDTETLARAVPRSSELQRSAPASVIVPLLPGAQRCFIDEARCFLPYAALELSPGRHEVSLEVGVYDAHGRRLLFGSQQDKLSIPDSDEVSPIPSPQSLVLWSENPSTGDRIGRIRIKRGYREENREVLTILSNLELRGHRAELLYLECRFLRADGSFVDSGFAPMMDSDGSFLCRSDLAVPSDVCRIYDRSLEIPLGALSLDEGTHDLFCQLSIVDASRKVLFGALERCTLEISGHSIAPLAVPSIENAEMESPDPMSDLQVGSFLVEPESRFNGASVIELGISLCASEWKSKICRVVFSVEQDPLITPTTKLRLRPQRQTLCCGGFDAPTRQALIAHFSAAEIASFLLLPPEGVKLLARVQVYTLDDCLLFNRTRPFILRQQVVTGSTQMAAFAGTGNARIVSLATRPIVGTPQIKTDVAVNLRLDDIEACRFSLYHEILDPEGKAVRQNVGDEGSTLAGSIVSVDFSESNFRSRFREGWFQIHLDLENNLNPPGDAYLPNPGAYTLKALLFSESGKLLHVVHQPLLIRGRNFPESPLAISYDFDRAIILDMDEPGASPSLKESVFARVKDWLKLLRRAA